MVLLLSIVAAIAVEQSGNRQAARDLAAIAVRIEGRIQDQMALLSSLRGFLSATNYRVEPSAIRRFLGLNDRNGLTAGMQGVGIALHQKADDVAQAEAILERAYGQRRGVWPETDQADRFPIVLLEPADERNRAAYGYDMYAEPVRREAMDRAWRSGEAAATAPLELVQEITADKQIGFLIYLPVTRDDGTIHSLVYAPYRVGDMMHEVLTRPSDLGVVARVLDTATGTVMLEPERELVSTASFPITVADREWRVDLAYRDSAATFNRPSFLLLVGGGLVAVLLQWLLQQREQRIEAELDAAREVRRSAELRGLLLEETRHRLKNSVARVSAIARLTARQVETKEDFLILFERQLHALAAAQDLLNPTLEGGVDLRALLDAELASVGGNREAIVVEGEPVRLNSNQAQALGLILHELLTNSLKYGALSQERGLLTVRWTVLERARMEWIETGARPADVQASGFGTRLIDTLVTRQLGGRLSRRSTEDGMRIDIDWPPAVL
jgi:Signal transduction histidine kinase